jgi:hypothetical protein
MDTYLKFTCCVCLLTWSVYVLGQEQSCAGWQDHDRWMRPQIEGKINNRAIKIII